MTTLAGQVQTGLAFLDRFVGIWGYDHAAAAATRFGPDVAGSVMHTGSSARIADCSGAVTRALVEGGMPRHHEGFPESSGDMNRWADAHPDRLLWSVRGGGKYGTKGEAIQQAPDGAIFGIGGYLNGDAGHTGFLRPVARTLESSSGTNGVARASAYRFTARHPITHVYLAPTNYGSPPPTPAPPAQQREIPQKASAMETIHYPVQNQVHTFWIDTKGHVRHLWNVPGNPVPGGERMPHPTETFLADWGLSVYMDMLTLDLVVRGVVGDGACGEFRWAAKNTGPWGFTVQGRNL